MAKQIDILCSEITLYNAWSVVKEKGSAGGIDGMTIQEFDKEKRKQIPMLAEELKNGTWKPYPYLEIEIPQSKDLTEKRKLGMIAIRDKIVQQGIRAIIEPRYDRIFVGNSYALCRRSSRGSSPLAMTAFSWATVMAIAQGKAQRRLFVGCCRSAKTKSTNTY